MKIKELRQGDRVKTVHTIFDSRNGHIKPGTLGQVVKVLDGYAPREPDYFYCTQSTRESRAHTQVLKVKFGKRIHILSGWYLKRS